MANTVTIDLRSPVKDAGVELRALTMREPRVGDQLKVWKLNGVSDMEKEIRLFANLCEVSTGAIEELTPRDYKKLLSAYMDFTKEDEGE